MDLQAWKEAAGRYLLTFQEYLAAVAIAQLGQLDVEPVADFLADHVGKYTAN